MGGLLIRRVGAGRCVSQVLCDAHRALSCCGGGAATLAYWRWLLLRDLPPMYLASRQHQTLLSCSSPAQKSAIVGRENNELLYDEQTNQQIPERDETKVGSKSLNMKI